MNVEVHEFGYERNRLIVIDDFLPEAERYVEMAAAIAPFAPEAVTAYPGRRHQLTPDQPASQYVRTALETVAPAINHVFSARGFSIIKASFSIVTKRASELSPQQRLPHWDSTDPNYIAILHHLHHVPGTGTGFYRHRRTGFERASESRHTVFDEALALDMAAYGPPGNAFFAESDPRYEKIYEAPGKFNRLLVYHGALFHSGLIPNDFAYDPDPRAGRLTGTIFVRMVPGPGRSV